MVCYKVGAGLAAIALSAHQNAAEGVELVVVRSSLLLFEYVFKFLFIKDLHYLTGNEGQALLLFRFRRGHAKLQISHIGGNPATCSTHHITLLNQIRLNHIFQGA